MGLLGPGPGCKEPFARYLQFIISHVITSLALTVLGSLTNTSRAAATVVMLGPGPAGGMRRCPRAGMAL